MPLGGLVAGAIGGIAGLFGAKKTTTGTQNSTSNTSSTANTTGTSTQNQTNTNVANLSPLQQALSGSFLTQAQGLQNEANNTAGLSQAGLENINSGSKAATTALANSIASRGLSFSPAAAVAQNQNNLSRIGQQNQFLATLPQIQQQLRQQALQSTVQAFSALPTNTTQTGTATGTTNQTQTGNSTTTGNINQTGTVSGNPIAGTVSGAGAGLFAPQSPNSGLSNLLSSFGYGAGNPNSGGYSTQTPNPLTGSVD